MGTPVWVWLIAVLAWLLFLVVAWSLLAAASDADDRMDQLP